MKEPSQAESPLTGKSFLHAWKRFELLLGRRKAVGWLAVVLAVPLLWFGNILSTEWVDLAIIDGLRGLESRFATPDSSLVVVEIDTATLEKVGKPWPWPRADLARLIERLNQASPSILILDIVLQHPELQDGGVGDARLVQAIASAGNVALVSLLEESLTVFGRELNHFRNAESFRNVALLEGFVRTLTDPDGVYRRFPCHDERLLVDSCALQVISRLRPELLKTGNRIPDESLLAFAEKNGGIPLVSAVRLLDGSFPLDRLRGRIVTLGVTDPDSRDFFSTPVGIKPGVAILASSIDTLLRGKTAVRLNGWLWRGCAVGLSLLLCYAGTGAIFDGRGLRRLFVFVCLTGLLLIGAVWLGRFPPFGLWIMLWFWTHLVWFTGHKLLEFMDFQAVKIETTAARDIQNLIYPSSDWKDDRGYWCRALVIPSDEVGGDYVDFQQLADGSLVFIMSDVAGHGFPAALLTASAKTCTMLLARWDLLTAPNLAFTLNSLLFDFMRKRRMMTAIIGHLNPIDGKILLVFCGQPPAFLVKADGITEEIGASNYPLGAVQNLKLKTRELTLGPGEILTLYTDGVPEAINWEDSPFGYPAWQKSLGKRVSEIADTAPLNDLLIDVRTFAAGRPFMDDVALMLIGRRKEQIVTCGAESEK
ncbi:MAG: CHASE2 domain-containing protein [Candidatus Ozemobacteraceae bacterium]